MKTILNFKSAKMLAICLTALLVAGCSNADEPKIEVGDTVTNGEKLHTSDGRGPLRTLPLGATNIKYIGSGWYTFELKGACFLLAEHYRASVMAAADVCN